jgi:hypothetical protein
MTRKGTDEVRRATRRLVAAQTAAFAASGVGVGLAPLPLSGAHGSWAGAMLAVLGLAAGAGALVGGRLMDRGDPRRRLAAAHAVYALAGLGAAAAAAARSPGWLLAAAALAGAGQGAALLGRVAVAALHASCRRGRALGRMLTIGALGAAAGPVAVAGAQELAQRTGLDPLALPWLALPALGALGVWAVIGADRETLAPAEPAEPAPAAPRAAPAPRPDGAAPLAVVALAAAQVAMVAVMALAPTAVGRHTGSGAAMAVAIAVHQLGMYGLASPIGRLIDRAGHGAGLAFGTGSCAAGAVLACAPLPPAAAMAGLVVVGAGWSAVYLSATALIGARRTRGSAGAMGGADLMAAAAGAAAALGAGIAAEAAGSAAVGVAAAVPLAALAWAALARPGPTASA